MFDIAIVGTSLNSTVDNVEAVDRLYQDAIDTLPFTAKQIQEIPNITSKPNLLKMALQLVNINGDNIKMVDVSAFKEKYTEFYELTAIRHYDAPQTAPINIFEYNTDESSTESCGDSLAVIVDSMLGVTLDNLNTIRGSSAFGDPRAQNPVLILLTTSLNAINELTRLSSNLSSLLQKQFQAALNALNHLSAILSWMNTMYQSLITRYNKYYNDAAAEDKKIKPTLAADVQVNGDVFNGAVYFYTHKDANDDFFPKYRYWTMNGESGIAVKVSGEGPIDGAIPDSEIFPRVYTDNRTYYFFRIDNITNYIKQVSQKVAVINPNYSNDLSDTEKSFGALFGTIKTLIAGFNSNSTAIDLVGNSTSSTNSIMNRISQDIQSFSAGISQYLNQFISATSSYQQNTVWK